MSKRNKKRQSRQQTGNGRQVADQISSAPVAKKPYESGFNPDYSQTIKDLKRIGILAGSFFIILIVLTFVLG